MFLHFDFALNVARMHGLNLHKLTPKYRSHGLLNCAEIWFWFLTCPGDRAVVDIRLHWNPSGGQPHGFNH